jgi:hypothetical protein
MAGVFHGLDAGRAAVTVPSNDVKRTLGGQPLAWRGGQPAGSF